MASSRLFGDRCRALFASVKAAAAASASTSAAAAAKPKRNSTGLTRVQPVSPALAKFLGSPEASRNEAVKKIWDYVKSKNLQNPENKREIFCDEKLKTIFADKDKVGFAEIVKLLSNHFK